MSAQREQSSRLTARLRARAPALPEEALVSADPARLSADPAGVCADPARVSADPAGVCADPARVLRARLKFVHTRLEFYGSVWGGYSSGLDFVRTLLEFYGPI